MVNDDTWPPEQPTSFTRLLLIHCQGHRTPEKVTAMAELTYYANDIGKVTLVTDHQRDKLNSEEKVHKTLYTTKATKDMAKVLESGKQSSFILIEGALESWHW